MAAPCFFMVYVIGSALFCCRYYTNVTQNKVLYIYGKAHFAEMSYLCGLKVT